MTHKILYSELQPCVLVSCSCKEAEPFLMIFRALNQVIACGHCQTEYGIEFDGQQIQVRQPEQPKRVAAN